MDNTNNISENVTLYRTNDDKTGVIEQYPKTTTSNVYDFESEKFLNDIVSETHSHIKDNTSKKHVEIVNSIPSRLENKSIFFKIDGSQQSISIPSTPSLSELKFEVGKLQSEMEYNQLQLQQSISELQQSSSPINKHLELLATAYQKLNKKISMTIVAHGDSMTYGQDTVSSNRRTTSFTVDGITQTTARASVTYPEALQTYLRDVYGNSTTVINKGYSGDYAGNSYTRWTVNSNADLALLMLGTNDANLGATYVPSDVRGNISVYMTNMRKIIQRYIKWNTAVILITPPKLRDIESPTSTSSIYAEPYRHALMLLGEEFGCPVVDGESLLAGCNHTYYSDGVHLNGKGYQYFAARLASVLIGFGVKNPVKIRSGNTLSVRQTQDNVVINGASVMYDPNAGGTEEGASGQGLLAVIPTTGKVTIGFETLEDNLILIPIQSYSTNAKLRVDLDFANEQGAIPILSGANRITPQGFKPLSSIEGTYSSNASQSFDGTININTTDKYIWITNAGWHSLKISNSGSGGSIYFNGFIVMSYKDFLELSQGNENGVAPNRIFQKLIYPAYTVNPPSVTSMDIPISELYEHFADTHFDNTEYWRAIPMKITLYNLQKNIIEHGFLWHCGDTPTIWGFDEWFIKQTNLVESPTEFRTITSITYDSTNMKYVVSFGGNTYWLGNITISPL